MKIPVFATALTVAGLTAAGAAAPAPLRVGAAAVDISVGPPEKSLAQLRDAINAANAGVTASILTDASGSRLLLRSSATGTGYFTLVPGASATAGTGARASALAGTTTNNAGWATPV